jgi:predicted flap endonuclease-1-like 5' DNA nuclease
MIIDLPISAFTMCYGPLALIILGFIGFAFLTDADARRTYLRDLDTRPDDEREPLTELPAVTQQIDAKVPAGGRVRLLPSDAAPVAASAVAEPPAPAPAPTPPAPPPVKEESSEDLPGKPGSGPDDLTRIEGIGPTISKALIAQGIDTFAKLATKSIDELREAVTAEGVSFVPSSESWADQASYAAKGDWEGLEVLQSKLVSGRYPPGYKSE